MRNKSHRTGNALWGILAAALLLVLATACGTTAMSTDDGMAGRELFTAVAINPEEPLTDGESGTVEIAVDRWSNQGEIVKLVDALGSEDRDSVLRTMMALQPVGYVQTPDQVSYPLHYAQEVPTRDGRVILVATTKPIGYWEGYNQVGNSGYPFTVIELRLDGEGSGEGRMAILSDLEPSPARDALQLESSLQEPVIRLHNVETQS